MSRRDRRGFIFIEVILGLFEAHNIAMAQPSGKGCAQATCITCEEVSVQGCTSSTMRT